MGDDSPDQNTSTRKPPHSQTRETGATPSTTSSPLPGDPSDAPRSDPPDYERELGVIEAITFVTRSCPSGVVIAAAENALEEIKKGGPEVMKQQAYFVLTAIKGWRGDRARQVHRSLTHYLEG